MGRIFSPESAKAQEQEDRTDEKGQVAMGSGSGMSQQRLLQQSGVIPEGARLHGTGTELL